MARQESAAPFTLVTGVQPQVASGKLKGIAVTTARRVSVLPNVPTIQESGIRDFDIAGWLGVMVPAGTPTPLVNRLQRAIGEACEWAKSGPDSTTLAQRSLATRPRNSPRNCTWISSAGAR